MRNGLETQSVAPAIVLTLLCKIVFSFASCSGLLRSNVIDGKFLDDVKARRTTLDESEMIDIEDDPYAQCLLWFLRSVVGETIFNKQIKLSPVPEWASITDEALVLLLVENVWEQSCDVEIHKKKKLDEFTRLSNERLRKGKNPLSIDRKAAEPKWSCGGAGKKVKQGWTVEGVAYFNKLVLSVARFRVTEQGRLFYAELYERQKLLRGGKAKKVQQVEEGDEAEAYNEFTSDIQTVLLDEDRAVPAGPDAALEEDGVAQPGLQHRFDVEEVTDEAAV